jgi:protein-disulfide isomerase
MSKQRSKLTRQERREQQKKAKLQQRIIVGATGILILAAVIFVTWQQIGGSTALPAEAVADPSLGPDTAPVEIVEYADFGCPACRSWHNAGIMDQVEAAFGDQVRFVWKDFPVITPQSPKAAEAGQCAAAQGKFWAFHDYVYENFAGLEVSTLKQYASAAGLDRDAFDQCLDSGQMVRKVRANEQEARRLGLRGTPGFTINGKPLPAPPGFEQLALLIQQELNQ